MQRVAAEHARRSPNPQMTADQPDALPTEQPHIHGVSTVLIVEQKLGIVKARKSDSDEYGLDFDTLIFGEPLQHLAKVCSA